MNCHQQTRRKVIKTLYLLSATSTVQRGCFPDLKSNIQVSVFGDHPFAPNHRWRKAGPCAKRPGGLFRRCCCRQPCQSMRRRNNRPDQHRTKRPDLELRKIFSAGCASSRLLRVAIPRSVTATAAPSSTYQTYFSTYATNVGRACTRLRSIRPDADANRPCRRT